MILKAGSFAFPLGTVELSITRRDRKTAALQDWAEEVTWNVKYRPLSQLADSSAAMAAIKTKLDALENALSGSIGNLILYQPNGSTKTHHQLLTSQCIGGIRLIERPSYPEGRNVEGVTMRTVSMTFQGLRVLPNSTAQVQSFEESLDFEPNGTAYGHLEPKFGYPVKQELKKRMVYRAVQRGSCVGIYQRPEPPPAIFPSALKFTKPRVTKGSPERQGDNYINWPIAWEYVYESAYPLSGSPNVWIS